MAKTAREKIARAFHVSFKLPEQAEKLLDDYKAEVIAEYKASAVAAIREGAETHRITHKDSGHTRGMCDGIRKAADLLDEYKAPQQASSPLTIGSITGCPYCGHWGPSMGHPACYDAAVNAAKKLRGIAEKATLHGMPVDASLMRAADLIDPEAG